MRAIRILSVGASILAVINLVVVGGGFIGGESSTLGGLALYIALVEWLVRGGLLLALVAALTMLVLVDAARSHQRIWFRAMLGLALVLALVLYVALLSRDRGTLTIGVVFLIWPVVASLTALWYAFGAMLARGALDPDGSTATRHRILQALAVVALLVLGVPVTLTMLRIVSDGLPTPGPLVPGVIPRANNQLWLPLQEPLVVAVGTLAVADTAGRRRRAWRALLLTLTGLAVLLVFVSGNGYILYVALEGLMLRSPWVYFDLVFGAPVVAMLLVPLVALIYTLRTAPRVQAPAFPLS